MYGSIGGLEYEVPQSRLYCLCINVALRSTALQCICRVIRRSSMTMKAHTYYIIFGRPPIRGEASPMVLVACRGVVGPGTRETASPLFSTGERVPHSIQLFELKFVQKLVHCRNWLLTETQCKIISVQHVCRPKLFKKSLSKSCFRRPPPLLFRTTPLSGGQTGEWALVQEEQMGPLLTPGKISLNR